MFLKRDLKFLKLFNLKFQSLFSSFHAGRTHTPFWRHDNQHDDSHLNATQPNATHHNDTKLNATQHKDTLHNDIKRNDTKLNNMPHKTKQSTYTI